MCMCVILGPIPVEICNLRALEVLDLGHNRFTGIYPNKLMQQQQQQQEEEEESAWRGGLKSGNCSSCRVTICRTIFAHRFTVARSLSAQTYFNCSSRTGKIPEKIGELTNLQELLLQDNLLTGNAAPRHATRYYFGSRF